MCRDAAMAFSITSIPQFHFYKEGKEFQKFTGANEARLFDCISSLSEEVASSTISHRNLMYREFKPMNLKPQTFTKASQFSKMKEFVTAFLESEEFK